MNKPTPQDDTPVARRSRQVRESKDSDALHKSRKSMDELLVVNKKIAKSLAKKDTKSKANPEDGKVAKLVKGATIATKALSDTDGAIKAWRAMSKKGEQRFQAEYTKLNRLHADLAKSLETENDAGEIKRIEAELNSNRVSIKALIAEREKTTKFFGGESIVATLKKSVQGSLDAVKTTLQETLHVGGNASGKPMPVEIPPEITKKLIDANRKIAEDVAKTTEAKADKRQSKAEKTKAVLDDKREAKAEAKADKRQSKAEKTADAKEAIKESKGRAKERVKERAEANHDVKETAKATNRNKKQQEALIGSDVAIDEAQAKRDQAREKRDAKRQVAKSDIAKLADSLEASFASRFGGEDSSILDDLLDGDDRGKKGNKGKGKGKGRNPKGKASKPPKAPRVPKAPSAKPPTGARGLTSKVGNVAGKAGRMVANVGSKVVSGGTALAGQLTGSVGAASGAVTAGAVAVSAVAGAAIGTKLVESGIFGENLASQYNLGDIMSDLFGDGTRNIERAIQAEKEKTLERADKQFKDFKPAGPWTGVSEARLKELQAPNQLMIVNRYFALWMREQEWFAVSNIMNNHRDAEKLPQQKRDEAHGIWKQANAERIKYKKEYIIKVGNFGTDAVNTPEAMAKADAKANNKVKQQAQKAEANSASSGALTQQVATANPPKFNTPTGTTNGGGPTGSNGVVVPNVPNAKGTSAPSAQGTQSPPSRQSAPSSNADIQGFESWLMSQFIPALAGAIAKQIPQGGGNQQAPNQSNQNARQSQQGKPTNQAVMPTPPIYK